MLCQKCHKNLATVRYAEVVDGQVKELHMCTGCLNRHHAEESTGFALSGEAPAPKTARRRRKPSESLTVSVVCESCGTDSRQVVRDGKVGCPVCYNTFGDELENAIRERNAAVIHRGKAPNRDDEREKLRVELQTKRALLRSALRSEKYEEAAIMRDDIRTLERRAGIVPMDSLTSGGKDA
jgi:protein arginine kinase activator